MNFDKWERKFGQYSIQSLPLIIILCYGVGYLIKLINPSFLNYLSLDPYRIIHGQIWRLVTWIILPPSSSSFFLVLLLLFCLYSIAVSIERVIGTFRLNIFIFGGMLFTILGAFALMGALWIIYDGDMTGMIFSLYAPFISSYYIYMSLFVVYALAFPDARFLFMFIIPVKAKWMIVLYIVDFVWEFYAGNIFQRVVLVAAFLNFIVFWTGIRRGRAVHLTAAQKAMRERFKAAEAKANAMGRGMASGGNKNQITRHKCAICGCTEIDKPDMQFRFCSKCDGAYEYCETHLYTHTHVKNS